MTARDRAADDAMAAMREVTGRARPAAADFSGAIAGFLAKQTDIGGRLLGVTLDQTPRSSGASSGTVLLDASVATPKGVVVLPLVFRYDLGGTFFFQYDLPAQFAVMRALEPTGFPAPRAVWLDSAGEIAGRPGLFMRRVDAPAPGGQPFAQGPLAQASAADRHAMIANAIRCFARLHKLDADALPLSVLQTRGKGDHYIARAVDWDFAELMHAVPPGFGGERRSYYDFVRADLLRVHDRLLASAPQDRVAELVHGDPNLSNVMYRGTNVAALLDWELCHLGLGEADLAYCMAGMAHFLLTLAPVPGVPSEQELLSLYEHARGPVRDWEFCRLWGEWRLGVYQVMAFSRLPPGMRDVEEMYWNNTRQRLSRLLPL